MPTYKAGIRTKQRIIDVAKRLFYLDGLNDVSVTRLCKEAEVKLGTFSYHFPKKMSLVRYIYDEYVTRSWDYARSRNGTAGEVRLHMNAVALYYYNIYKDSRIAAFHNDVLLAGSMNDFLFNSRDMAACFVQEGNVKNEIDDRLFGKLVLADNGVRRELNLVFIGSHPKPSLDDIVCLIQDIYAVTGRLFGYPVDKLMEFIAESRNFVINNEGSGIRLLP